MKPTSVETSELLTANPLVGNPPVAVELLGYIRALKRRLGSRVVILGHHYQRDEVVEFADRSGDSLDLSVFAGQQKDAKYIVFCGVHFMAETADILSAPDQVVLLPDVRAGCSMADMAAIDQVEECWSELAGATDKRIIPITYINSAADLKAFVGRHDGAVCTSSNAAKILEWAFRQAPKVLFFPDQHLGRNTAYRMGIPLEEMVVYDPHAPGGGNAPEDYARSRVVLWKGHCSVHQNFLPSNPPFWRAKVPGIKILVHPECQFEVVQQADVVGSTKKIVETVENAPAGSKWAIGTEHHLVNRLRQRFPNKFITSLAPFACQCSTMFRISPEALCATLVAIDEDRVFDAYRSGDDTAHWWRVIQVPPEIARDARLALNRMLEMR